VNVVSDTGPLIALAKVDQLSLLQALFRQVHIPSAVHHELLTKPGPESPRLKGALQGILKLTPSTTLLPAVAIATARLHRKLSSERCFVL
jgi:predicted nucleic acid-binding protein